MRGILQRSVARARTIGPAVCVTLFDPIVPAWVYAALWAINWGRSRLSRVGALN